MDSDLRLRLEAKRTEIRRSTLRTAYATKIAEVCDGLSVGFYDPLETARIRLVTCTRLAHCELRPVGEVQSFLALTQAEGLIEAQDMVLLLHHNDDLVGAVELRFGDLAGHVRQLQCVDLGNAVTALMARNWMAASPAKSICLEFVFDEVRGALGKVWPRDLSTSPPGA